MTAYYNENDAFAANWLRNLIKEGLIADGEVDTRDIRQVQAADLEGFAQCHFFAGIGGWSYALRLAGWPDERQVWTGSCPCQPFSAAGKQKGFADDRHLWPVWRELVRERRPATVFGEQVAAATQWLGLVRGDLEAMDYAMGAMPVQAASAGADHLRDRYWFVADNGVGRRAGPGSGEGEQSRRTEAIGASYSGVSLGDTGSKRLSLGPLTKIERRDIWNEGETLTAPSNRSIPLAHANFVGTGEEWQQRSGEFSGTGSDQEACDSSDLANGNAGQCNGTNAEVCTGGNAADSGHEWVIGADGKSRRVKSGIRLLVNGFPSRVGLLRGFGNAIDPRPASQFIGAYMDTLS